MDVDELIREYAAMDAVAADIISDKHQVWFLLVHCMYY